MIHRPRRLRVLVFCALLLTSASPAFAEWQFAPFFGWSFATNTTFLDNENAAAHTHRAFGIAVTRLGRGPFGVEGLAAYIPGFFNDPKLQGRDNLVIGSRVYAVMGNVVVTSASHWNEYGLRPYLSGGLGLLRAVESDPNDFLPVHKSLLGMNVGGGAVGFVTDRTGVRFDLRFFRNLHDTEDLDKSTIAGRTHLRYWVASVGLVLR